METARDTARAAETTLAHEADELSLNEAHRLTGVKCERCGGSFERRTNDRLCPACLAPLAGLRRSAGLSQAALASRVGCRPATIRELERDRYHPALALSDRLAAELEVEVRDVFPSLQITKGEAQRILGMTSRTLKRLCDEGKLPSTCDGHWHRIDYASVLQLAAEREELRTEWISFHAAESEYDLPWWLLAQLERGGKLDVKVGDRRRTRLVRRSQLRVVRQELVDNRKRVHCPRCRRWPKLGRKAHAECLGPLGSHAYWLDPETRQVRRRTHSEVVRARLAQRSVAEVISWYRSRFEAEPTRRQVGKWSFRKGGGRPRTDASSDYDEALTIIRALYAETHASERDLERLTGKSRRVVRRALGRS